MKNTTNISQELFEIIERYINGTLTSQELKDVNQLLELDDEFKNKVDEIKTLISGIEAQSLKEQLDDFHKDIPKTIENVKPQKKVRYLNFSKLAIAAALAIAVGSVWFFSTPQNEQLYAKYFKPDPGLPTTMSSTNNFEFYNAMVKYKHGDYTEAINKWHVLQLKKPKNDTLNYFLGVAHLANKNTIDAIPYLERTIDDNSNFILLNEAYYYLGMAYLKEGNLDLAIKNLKLSNTETAKSILTKLTE